MERDAGLCGNTLKIIGLITMTLDHVGLLLLNDYLLFRIIGRLAFPIFAYMIAEGCHYTKNKRKYFLRIFILGLLCQIVYYIAEHSMYQGILMTFSVSVLFCYVIQWVQEQQKKIVWILPVLLGLFLAVLCGKIPLFPEHRHIIFDYGFWGIMLPVFIVLGRNRRQQILLAAAGLVLIASDPDCGLGGIQWYSLISLLPLACYNGRKGTWNLKYLFYIYYPLHMAVIYGLVLLVK